MGKSKNELKNLLKVFTQKFNNQNDVFEKIEEDYLKDRKDFLKILQKHQPKTIPFTEFNQAYQWWRRLKEINVKEKENKNKILQKAREVKNCIKNHFKNLTDLGGGDPELGREFEEKYLYG
jgi:hypothetical protein